MLGRHVLCRHEHRDQRQDAKGDDQQNIDRGAREAGRVDHVGNGLGELRDDVEKALALGHHLSDGEEAKEDRHLDDHGQAAAERIELVVRVELLHLLGLALGVVGVALLYLLHHRLQGLHLGRRGGRLGHQRHDDDADDDRQHDDGDTPVAAESREPLKDRVQEINKPIPHCSSEPS